MSLKTLIFGHRGFPAKFPENSLAGFRYALTHQIDGIEFDVHLTKDQVPVIMHDETIDRTTNDSGEICSYSLNQLRQFQLKNQEPIPTLAEFLQLVGQHEVQLNLELKTDQIHYPNIEKIVLAQVKQFSLVKPVIFSSFNLATLKNCQKLDPHQQYCWLTKQQVAEPEAFVEHEHLAGLHLHQFQPGIKCQRIWTIDDPKTAKTLLAHHVAGIITNDFEKLRQLCK
ncbi:glycerophosphodiester phosphodiesterase family protein [Liquorilactobacillus vini]|uniref:glycerophosphodiester phosphodiesterase family protein n=1 Tax=Liquorilactobacillus vini TaxID=238015 RepID=UPI00029ABA0E|nr:glycerophosphodiester phosphodiesterase family protein [Liquorilactobacillus vini]